MKKNKAFIHPLKMKKNFTKKICNTFLISLSLSTTGLINNYAEAAVYPSQYDIVYHRISISVDPGTSGAITSGSVTTYFKTTASSVSQIGFDLNQSMNVSSIMYHGSAISTANYTHSSNALIITFPASIPVAGTLDSLTINYSGTPIAPGSPVPSGYNYSSTYKAIYTLGESFTGSTWWPCRDSLVDKIDSVDLIITTPSAYRAAGNGLVTEVISGPNRICTWKTRYRIATYMINFAAANYVDYQYNISTGGQTLPIHNYLYAADNTSTYQNAVNFIQSMMPVYVSLFNTNYPFLNEKYGIADCYGNWGALEVQSMTFCATGSITSNSILAHELSHQWFGDRLTTNDWHQIWLNEGFAQYCQSVIYPENLLSTSSAASSRSSLKSAVTSTSTTYVSDISSAQTIFVSSSSLYQPYEKGAMTLSMLRAWLGDANFFTALHNYLNAPGLAYDFTSVDSLQKYMQAQTPNDLTNFFSDWVYQKGRAKYAVKYQYVTNGVYIQLVQSPTSAGAGYFDMPVPLEIKNSTGLDTTIVIIDRNGTLYNSQTGYTYGTNTIYYPLSATPTITPIFDPMNKVLAVASSTTSSTSLNTLIILPVKDISMSTLSNNGSTKISWNITSDDDLQTITIEKSYDGKNFAGIGNENPVHISSNKYQGDYVDNIPGSGTIYYRLKVISKDGSFSYSTIKTVDNTIIWQLTIAPNPVKDYFIINLPANFVNNSKQLNINIYNSLGSLVLQKRINSGIYSINVSCQTFASGIYNVIVENENKQQLHTEFIKN